VTFSRGCSGGALSRGMARLPRIPSRQEPEVLVSPGSRCSKAERVLLRSAYAAEQCFPAMEDEARAAS